MMEPYDPLTEEEIREDLEAATEPCFIVASTDQSLVLLGQRDEHGDIAIAIYNEADLRHLMGALKAAEGAIIERRDSLR